MLGNISSTELFVVAAVLVLLFGGKKLPELARGLGEATKELKKAKSEFDDSLKEAKK